MLYIDQLRLSFQFFFLSEYWRIMEMILKLKCQQKSGQGLLVCFHRKISYMIDILNHFVDLIPSYQILFKFIKIMTSILIAYIYMCEYVGTIAIITGHYLICTKHWCAYLYLMKHYFLILCWKYTNDKVHGKVLKLYFFPEIINSHCWWIVFYS